MTSFDLLPSFESPPSNAGTQMRYFLYHISQYRQFYGHGLLSRKWYGNQGMAGAQLFQVELIRITMYANKWGTESLFSRKKIIGTSVYEI